MVEVVTRAEFYEFEAKLRARGFAEDQQDGVICRWRHAGTGLILDAMPARADILGFENRWHAAALPHAIERQLPSGSRLRAASPPFLLATKLEAFKSRGRGDLLGSRDFGDIIALTDGRAELIDEVLNSGPEVRGYIAEEIRGAAVNLAHDGRRRRRPCLLAHTDEFQLSRWSYSSTAEPRKEQRMVIVAGHIVVEPEQREAYLAGCQEVIEQARSAPGCLDFAITADLVDSGRIDIFERWETQAAVDAFRGSGPSDEQSGAMLSASVAEYDVADMRPLT